MLRKPSLAAVIAAAMTALAALPARASDPIDVRLRKVPHDGYEVQGLFSVQASSTAVWDVLADYENIPSFVSSMRLSRVKERHEDGTLILEQHAVGGLFFISKTVRVLLEVRRSPERMDFLDVRREDFRAYEGSWSTQETTDGTMVNYHLQVSPRFPAPGFLLKGVMKRGARGLLGQVRMEILRRSSLGPDRRDARSQAPVRGRARQDGEGDLRLR